MACNLMLDMQYLILKIFWKYRDMVFQMAKKSVCSEIEGAKIGVMVNIAYIFIST